MLGHLLLDARKREFHGAAVATRTSKHTSVARRSLLSASILLIALASPGPACTIFHPVHIVGPSFRVRVDDRGRPVKGLSMRLRGAVGGHRAITDPNGIARFHGLRPGSYHLSAEHDSGVPGGAEIEVKLPESRAITVPLRWPSGAVASASSIKGVLHMPSHMPGQPQRRTTVDLLEGVSGRTLQTTASDDRGGFDFDGLAPGLYFLRLPPDPDLIAIELDPRASAPQLELDLGWTSCGLWYVNQTQCPPTRLHLARLTGHVADAADSAIQDAEVLLVGPGDKIVEPIRSDAIGGFASTQPARGTFRLLIRRAGFSPLRADLTMDPSGDNSPVEVRLGVAGGCSGTRVQ